MDTRIKPGWPAFLDGAFDGLVLSFAGWTVFYQFALAFQFSMLWVGWPWIVLSGCVAVGSGLHAVRRARPVAQEDHELPPEPPAGRTPLLGMKAFGVGLAVLTLLAAFRERWGVWPLAVTAIALLLVQLLPWMSRRPPRQRHITNVEPRADPGVRSHAFALAVSLGFGVLGMFLLRPDADDAFYVNRATWVAERGTAATNDTMFSPNTLPPANDGGLLTPSIEALQGVVAHALGVAAPSVCYLLAVPVLGTMAGWTTWRLVRAWAPRYPAVAMAASMIFLVASADSVVGGYSLGRIWQGKATAYAILIPLVWLLLSRTIERARRTELVMLAAAGVAFVGLTTTSALLAPIIAGAALVASLVLRSRSLAIGAVAFLAAPLANGLAQAAGPAIGGGGESVRMGAGPAVSLVFGVSLAMVLLGLLALILVPRLVPSPIGVLLGCGSLATVVTLVPGVFALADAVTGAGPVAWRLLIAMPAWVLVGLLATMPLPDVLPQREGRRAASLSSGVGAMAAVVMVVPLAFGTFLWNGPGASLTSRPTWKVNQDALSDVRALRELDIPPGRWLMPPEQMSILAISSVGPFAVVPRSYYLTGLDVSRQNMIDRTILFFLVSGQERVEPRAVREALARLDVSVACVHEVAEVGPRVLSRAIRAPLKPVGHMNCGIVRPAI